MARETSVVTPQRFEEGFSYADYIEQIKVNKARFEAFYNFQIKPDDAAALRQLANRKGGPAKMLVLGEEWCADVIRGLPVLARVAEAAGLDLKIFPRDQHHDIMNEFLKEGQFMSIPTAVFYSSDHQYICHWIERPAVVDTEMEEISVAIKAENPGISDRDYGRERRARTSARAEAWQQSSVDELIDLLNKSVG